MIATIGTRPGRPYVDFAVEFPVGTVVALRAIAPAAGDRARFGGTLVAINVAADLTIAAALAWAWGLEAAVGYALVAGPIADLFFLRLDLWSTALATIGIAAWRRGLPSFAAMVPLLRRHALRKADSLSLRMRRSPFG